MMSDELGSNGAVAATRRPAALTERQVAEQLGLSVATLRAWRHRGKGPRSCGLGARCGTCPRTWTSSSARAQLTRSRIPRLMKIRSSGSWTYEPLETRSPVLDGLHGQRPSLPQTPGHDESARRHAAGARVDRGGGARPDCPLTSKGRSVSPKPSMHTWLRNGSGAPRAPSNSRRSGSASSRSTLATCRSPRSPRRRSQTSSVPVTMPALPIARSTWMSACCRVCSSPAAAGGPSPNTSGTCPSGSIQSGEP